jgi:hypothetical protein
MCDSFPKSAKNYLFAVIWGLLENANLSHPLPAYSELPRAWGVNISKMVYLFYSKVRKDLSGGVATNDIFRNELYWEKCRKALGPRHLIYRKLRRALEGKDKS